MAVDLGHTVCNVAGTGCPAAGISRGTGPQHIGNGFQICFFDVWLLLRHNGFHADCTGFFSQFLIQLFYSCLYIHRHAALLRCDLEFSIHTGDNSILRLTRKSGTLFLHKGLNRRFIYTCIQRNMHRLLFQILALHVLPDQTAACGVLLCFLQRIFIFAGVAQILRGSLQPVSCHIQRHAALFQARDIGGKLCLSLFLCQSAKCKPTRIDALRKGLLFRVDRKCKHTSKYCCKGQTSQHTALFHNLLPLSAFCCNAAFVRFGRCSGHFTS